MVLPMEAEVISQSPDTFGEDRYLDLCGPSVPTLALETVDDLSLGLRSKHSCAHSDSVLFLFFAKKYT